MASTGGRNIQVASIYRKSFLKLWAILYHSDLLLWKQDILSWSRGTPRSLSNSNSVAPPERRSTAAEATELSLLPRPHSIVFALQPTTHWLAALVRGHGGTHQMRVAGVHADSSVAHSETQSIKGLYLRHKFLSRSVNQKNVPSKGSNSHFIC